MNEEMLKLIRLAAQNDREAFGKFAEMLSKRVLSIAFKITKDKMHSEDVLSIVLVKTWENIDKIARLKNPIGYINTIAYNASLDILRKQKESPLLDTFPTKTLDSDLKIDIETALQKLNEQEREIVLYHIHAGFSFKRIAMLMNSTKKSVYLKYKNATQKIREFLTQ